MIAFTPGDVFLVTGASSGLGAAGALLLNRLGATVVATGRHEDRLETLKKESTAPERLIPAVKDLTTDEDSLPGWLKGLKDTYGKLRGLLHCAGICEVVPVRLQEAEGMRRQFEINVFAGYQLARAFLDRRNNTGKNAAAVFIASTGALRDNAGISSYAASKGAVIAMTRSLACEFLSQGIRVNCISPALIPTPMTQAIYPDLAARAAAYPLGPGSPEDVAQAAAFLLSDAARWMTGQNLILDGGNELQ